MCFLNAWNPRTFIGSGLSSRAVNVLMTRGSKKYEGLYGNNTSFLHNYLFVPHLEVFLVHTREPKSLEETVLVAVA